MSQARIAQLQAQKNLLEVTARAEKAKGVTSSKTQAQLQAVYNELRRLQTSQPSQPTRFKDLLAQRQNQPAPSPAPRPQQVQPPQSPFTQRQYDPAQFASRDRQAFQNMPGRATGLAPQSFGEQVQRRQAQQSAEYQRKANQPGTPENSRELVRRQMDALGIPDDVRAEYDAIVDSALFMRTTYLDPATNTRRRVSPLANAQAIKQTGQLDPNAAMEVIEALKTDGGLQQLRAEVEAFRERRKRGSELQQDVDAQNRRGTVNPNIAGAGAVIDVLSPQAAGATRFLNDNPNILGNALAGYEANVMDPVLGGMAAQLEPLRNFGLDPTAVQRAIVQAPKSSTRGIVSGASGMIRVPQLLGSKEWTALADKMDEAVAQQKPLDQTWLNKMAGVVGSIIPQVVPALFTGGATAGASVAGRMAASGVLGISEAAVNAASGFDQAVKSGGNIEQARMRAAKALPIDFLGSTILNKFGAFSDLAPAWRKAFAAAFTEGIQEGLQTAGEGYVATGKFDINTPEAREAFLFGAILGPAMGAGFNLDFGQPNPNQQAPTADPQAVPNPAPIDAPPVQQYAPRMTAADIEGAYESAPDEPGVIDPSQLGQVHPPTQERQPKVQTVYHRTQAPDAIVQSGFKPSASGDQGPGIYVALEPLQNVSGGRAWGDMPLVEAQLDVSRLLDVGDRNVFDHAIFAELPAPERTAILTAKARGDWSGVHQVLAANGYDGFIYQGSALVIPGTESAEALNRSVKVQQPKQPPTTRRFDSPPAASGVNLVALRGVAARESKSQADGNVAQQTHEQIVSLAQERAATDPVQVRTAYKQFTISRPDAIRVSPDGLHIEIRSGKQWVALTADYTPELARQLGIKVPEGYGAARAEMVNERNTRERNAREEADAKKLSDQRKYRDRLQAVLDSGKTEAGTPLTAQERRGVERVVAGMNEALGDDSAPQQAQEQHFAFIERGGKKFPVAGPFSSQQDLEASKRDIRDWIEREHPETVFEDLIYGKTTDEKTAKSYAARIKKVGGYTPDLQPQANTEVTRQSEQPTGPYSVESHRDVVKRIKEGRITADEFKSEYQRLVDSADAIAAELSKRTIKDLAGNNPRRLKKPEIIRQYLSEMRRQFALDESVTYMVGGSDGGSYNGAIDAIVAKITDEKLAEFAKKSSEAKAEREAQAESRAKAVAAPKSLDDYREYMRAKTRDGVSESKAYMALTPEQRAEMDALVAEDARLRRTKQPQPVAVTAATTDGEIIEAKHTKTGEPLFVVSPADRVDRDVYQQWLAAAKRLGGWYSSYRGNGAVPGFQFNNRGEAESFQAYLSGEDVSGDVAARQDAFKDDRTQSAAERLRTMANAMDERASGELAKDRKANTARRARMAEGAEAAARADQAFAATMRRIADAIESGKAKALSGVRQKVQVETLRDALNSARANELQEKYADDSRGRESARQEPPTPDTASYAEYPRYTLYRSQVARLGRALIQVQGGKQLGQALLKVADDVTAEYLKFAKANVSKVARFRKQSGEIASFPTKRDANAAIARSGLLGDAIALPVAKGENVIVMSPPKAQEEGIWQGDDDARFRIGAGTAEKVIALSKRHKIDLPWTLEITQERLARLKSMGIESGPELRAALREYAELRQAPKQADKIKQMEREMVGRVNDGLDFFPTPPDVIANMVVAAEIADGMKVLEPSAGMGHIADALREDGVNTDVIELSPKRAELLEAKGYNVVGSDFMEHSEGGYDRIVMNPPFSDGRAGQHIRHAYDLLADNGRLVAIVDEGVFFRQDKKTKEFRDWLESVGGTSEKIAAGAFNDSSLPVNTGVATRMVVVDKAPAKKQPPDTLNSPQRKSQAQPKGTIDVDGQARPRHNSNGQPIHHTDEGIRNFWKWFGDSKVVDNQGRPLVVYHGTAADFKEFVGDGSGVLGDYGKGAYFTTNPGYADGFTRKQGGRIVAAYLRLGDPLEVSNSSAMSRVWDRLIDIKKERGIASDDYSFGTQELIKELGRDGITVTSPVHESDERFYVAFDPTQIKSATGNQGTFNPQDPVILNKGNVQNSPAGAKPIPVTIEPLTRPGDRPIQVADIERKIDQVFGRTHRGTAAKGAEGSYDPKSSARWVRDGKFLAGIHEAGHQTSYQDQIMPHFTAEAMAELSSGHFDGTIPEGANQNVMDQERFAEFFVWWHVNPTVLSTIAPNAKKQFEAVMGQQNAKTLKGMRELSDMVRQYAGQSDLDLAGSNFVYGESKSLSQRIGQMFTGKNWQRLMDRLGYEVTDEFRPLLAAIDRMAGTNLRNGKEVMDSNNPEMWLRMMPYTPEMLEDGLKHGMVDWRLSEESGDWVRSTPSIAEWLAPLKPGTKEFGRNYRTASGYVAAKRHVDLAERYLRDAKEQIDAMRDVLDKKVQSRIEASNARIDAQVQGEIAGLVAQGKASKARVKTLLESAETRKAASEQRIKSTAKGALTRYERMVKGDAEWRGENSGIVPKGPDGRSSVEIAKNAIAAVESNADDLAMAKAFAEGIRAYGDWGLNQLVATGRLEPERAEAIRARNPYWFAVERKANLDEDIEAAEAFITGKKLGNYRETVNQFKGSQKSMTDIIAAQIGRNADILQEFHRNRSMRAVVEFLGEHGVSRGKAGEIHRVPVEEGIKVTDQRLVVWRDGEMQVWEVDPENKALAESIRAIAGMRDDSLIESLGGKIITAPTAVTRNLILNAPPFMLRNIVRDTVHRVTAVGGTPLDTIKPKSKFIKDNYDSLALGLGKSTDIANKSRWESNQESVIKEATKNEMVIAKIPRLYSDLREQSERANRAAVFDRLFKKHLAAGNSKLESALYAAHMARESMTDFRKGGRSSRALSRFIPFFNAAVAGMRTKARLYRNNPVKGAANLAAYAAVGLALEAAWAAYGGEEEEKRLERISPYQRDMFWNFRVGGDDGFWLSIPKGHDEALGVGMIHRMILAANGKDAPEMQSVGSLAKDTIGPISGVDDVFGGWGPLMEIAYNRSLYNDKEIVPVYDDGPMHERTGVKYASPIGQALHAKLGLDARQWDYILENSTGYYGRAVTGVAEAAAEGDMDKVGRVGLRFTGINLPGSPTSQAEVISVDNYLNLWDEKPTAWRDAKSAYYEAKGEAAREKAGKKLIALARKWNQKFESIEGKNKAARDAILKDYFEAFK